MNEIAAAARSLPGHWHREEYTDGQGNFCGIGHVLKQAGLEDEQLVTGDFEMTPTLRAQIDVMSQVAREQYSERVGPWQSFAAFNDNPETTEDEVVAVMDKASIEWDTRV